MIKDNAMPQKKINKNGRPKKDIDWNLFENLCGLQCTLTEIAFALNMSEDSVENKCKEYYSKSFSDIFAIKRGKGKISLRRTQWKLAEKNPAMAIFLGKNYLGQSDKQEHEHTGKDGEQLTTRVIIINDTLDENGNGNGNDKRNKN